MDKKILLLLAIFHTIFAFSQTTTSKPDSSTKKQLYAKRTTQTFDIDGELNESEWQSAAVATDFIMLEPDNGKAIDPSKKTEVRVLFDNEAIYIGAVLNDDEPEKIMREITQRDDDGATDFFGFSINGYNDGQQEFRFIITAAGVQWDANANSTTGEDASWDAIWESNVKVTSTGWTVEAKLPYSALRFSKDPKQTWGIQFFRQLRRYRQLYTWNYVDNNKGSLEQQSGELQGIENIKTPTRLFFFPYASTYVSNSKENGTKTEFKGGMDIKYGINDAFTLDAILIPDFGQTAFDNQILNLGPFEQQFNENRPFFTEGTDLFNKGSLFYSRRIGGKPSLRKSQLNNDIKTEDEIIENYPDKINLVNALKISGRTKKGLGIGFLNAVTEKTDVTLKDTITNTRRSITVEPLANYNILTLDQRFNKNSSVSFINTNVLRNQEFRDANVSALVFDLNTKKNTFNLSGDFKYSYVNEYQKLENKKGYNTSLSFAETSGKIRFSVTTNYITKEFDNNDLGINFKTNYLGTYGNLHYRILKPTKTFNSLTANMNVNSEFENNTGKLQAGNINFNLNSTFKNNDGFGGGLFIRPFEVHDFYAPQSEGRYVTFPKYYETWVYYSSNYNRKFAVDFNPWIGTTSEVDRNSYGFSFSPRYRFSNKLMVILGYDYSKENNTIGFYDHQDDNILFEKRDINTSTVYLKSKFALNNKMTININTRYYWSYVDGKGFKDLQNDGSLQSIALNEPSSQDFSSWNLDCSYSWWIAPGSQLNILYRNNSGSYEDGLNRVEKNLSRNFENLFGDKLNHTFSISLRYFLDFNRVNNWI